MSDCRNPHLSAYDRASIEDAERSTKAAQTAQGCADDEIVYGFQFCGVPSSTMLGETVFDSVGEPIGWIVANGKNGDFLPTTAEDEDANCKKADSLQDSREKLEAAAHTAAGYIYGRGFTNGLADAWNDDEVDTATNQIIQLLDRQAAITQDETIHDYNIAARESGRILRDEIAELQADNDYLRDRNEKLDCEVRDWKGEAKTQRNNFEQATEARKHWQRKYENLKATSYSAEAPSDESELARELGKALAERDMYREKLGRALDAAHEIVRIMEDER